MRILKYLFLLLLLFLIGLTVFVTTQKGDYDITQSKVIKTQRTTVYNFINDYRNWETFGSWLKGDPSLKINYSKNTSGPGAAYSWNSSQDEGNIQTVETKENEAISQKMNFNGAESEIHWTFKDTLGATKVSWRTRGKMTAIMKIKAFFQGGTASAIGEIQDKSLANLDKTLDYEINTYAIKINGLVTRPKTFYIGQAINNYEGKSIKNIKILLPKMIRFFEKNKMAMHGKPFALYHKTTNGIVNLSVCAPVRDSIHIMPGSEVNSGKMEAVTALKVTLSGDYSHLASAKIKALDYIAKNSLRQNTAHPLTETYVKTVKDSKQPSKWITEIYVPVSQKAAAPRTYKSRDSSATSTVAVPAGVSVNE